MFLGSRVDDALSLYYRRILDHDERLDLAQVKDAYRDLWHTGLQAEEQQLGIDWQDIPQHEAFDLGLQALELTFEQLVPKLGEPLAVQRRRRVHARARASRSGRSSATWTSKPAPALRAASRSTGSSTTR